MSKLLIDESPLQVLPRLAVAIGLNEAIVLQQIHYWLGRSGVKRNGHQWVYNTVQQWQEQFPFWSPDTVRRALASLKDSGLLIAEALAENRFDKTMYYRIDYTQLAIIEDGILPPSEDSNLQPSEPAKSNPLIKTENTQQIPTDNISTEAAFEEFWNAGMVKTGKKKALSIFASLVKRDKLDAGPFAKLLADDVKARLKAGQFGFDKLHPTTYLNGERWNDAMASPTGKPSAHTNFSEKKYAGTPDDEISWLNAQGGEGERPVR